MGNSRIAPNAISTGRVRDAAVTAAKLADGAVTNPKLGANAVNTSNLLDQAVRSAKIGTNAVGTEKINDGAVTGEKLGTGLQPIWVVADRDGSKVRSTAGVVGTAPISDGVREVTYSRSIASCALIATVTDENGGVGGNITAYVDPDNNSKARVKTGLESGPVSFGFTVVAFC